MSAPDGHIELERTVDSIVVGHRHREDLGDLDPLVASIRRDGLLQPITITPDGHLICGARRLAAIKRLGWKTVNVWVRSGISDRLGRLLAEQDDNLLHKPLTQLESAALYRELKTLLAEDAARRQEATRFHPTEQGGEDGGANLAPPQFEPGKARAQAAQMVTGRNSYTTLERIGRLEELAADETQPEQVRQRAAEELAVIRAGGGVVASHQRINAELSLAELDQLAADTAQPAGVRERARMEAAAIREAAQAEKAAELERLATDALARVKGGRKAKREKLTPVVPGEPMPFPLRVFVLTWDELDGWWLHYDPAEVGPALTPEQWERFEATVTGTLAFAEASRAARDHRAQDIA
ncbi:ParB/RepB/Spo0J family partition protein [Skermania piniformis]|uniref:ParB N-terminal domain-containing protein n=1 Tax=Skermania pinensis TaxID=39122 RepID=A0ABX8S5M9_9ACTN|nr:ParB N-terminal domain-containing protein [Skermania piniformis]QXQ13048.1 ParB N-terminal domain-containing protein [Skermania piniformis]